MKARRHADEDIYWLSCQASELYLKALLAALTDPHLYTHDLGELLDSIKNLSIDVSENTMIVTEILTPHHTLARYPGKRVYTYNSSRTKLCIETWRRSFPG